MRSMPSPPDERFRARRLVATRAPVARRTRRGRRATRRVAATFARAVALVALIAGVPVRADTPRDSTVVVGLRAEPATLHPLYVTSVAGREIVELLYPTLLEEGRDALHFGPRLARSWEVRDDGRTVVFHLRRDMRWRDGEPVTADDVRFTWLLHTDTTVAWPHASTKQWIDDVEVLDRWTVAFRFGRRDLYALADANEGVILPRHVLEGVDRRALRSHAIARRSEGAGPFDLVRWEAGSFIELRARAGRSARAPGVRRVVFRIVPDLPTLLARVEHGDIDAFDGVPADAARRLAKRDDLRVIVYPSRRYAFVAWNCEHGALRDARVRRALGMAIDRRELIDALWGEYAQPVDAAIHPAVWGHLSTLAPLAHAPDSARALLGRAGWIDRDGDGTRENAAGEVLAVEILSSDNPVSVDGATIVQRDLAAVGVRARVRVLEFGAFTSRVLDGDYDAAWINWRAGTRADLTPMWHSASVPPRGYNFVRIRDARLDALVEAARASTDADSALSLWHEAQRRIHALQPAYFVAVPSEIAVMNRRLCAVEPTAAGLLATIRRWRLAPGCDGAGGFDAGE